MGFDGSWSDAWDQGHTPWDRGESPPVLAELLARDVLPKGRVLVPGAGSGYDVASFARGGFSAVASDLAEGAKLAFEAKHPELNVDYIIGDFFEDPRLEAGSFDVIWDYTFLCAIDPSLRTRWAARCRSLLREGGQLVTLIFPVLPKQMDKNGPPWPMDPQLVKQWLSEGFEEMELSAVKKSASDRQGKEWLGRFRRIS